MLDDPHEYRALILLPQPPLQQRLAQAAPGGRSVHQARYSMIAHPFGLEFQNSNGWLLEFVAAALADSPVPGRRAAQDYLRRSGYRPDVIEVSPAERLGASLFRANVAFSDHPLPDRLRGKYAIVSVESIARYLGERQHLQSAEEIALAAP